MRTGCLTNFYAEWHGTAFTYLGRPCLLGIVRDASKQIQADQSLHQHVKTRNHEQTRLLEISLTLALKLDFQPGLILDQLREIIEYSHGGLVPLAPYILIPSASKTLGVSIVFTLVALFIFGYVKGRFTGARPFRSAIQTALIGGLAAVAAFGQNHFQMSEVSYAFK